jgi:hypothetical protein
MQDFLLAAAQFLNTTASHIFLTGKAGTGKTTFLKNLPNLTHKNYIVVAPTGIAALNAGGVTIHSQFLLPPFTFLPDRFLPDNFNEGSRLINQNTLARKHPLNSARKQVLRAIDLLVIDEVSMLRADLLDAIDYRMKAAKGNFKQSFGGAQVLFIGDLYQLPPVVKSDEWTTLQNYYRSPWFYEAKALQEEPLVYIELDKIFRQHDAHFIDILNNLRNNTATIADIDSLNKYFRTTEEIRALSEVITLTTHNYKADELNQQELKNLSAPSHFIHAHLEGEFPESMYPVLATMELKEGAQIMFVRNDNEGKMYFNGKLATIKKIEDEKVWVELAESHIRYQLKRERWENKRYTVSEGSNLEDEVIGSFEQYPIKLAWAITVHKSQGLTFDKAIIDVGQAFADGQVYVALSRLRSLDGLILRTHINTSAISTDKQVVAFAKENHKPNQLATVMKTRQQDFIQQLLDQTFDFAPLIRELHYVQKNQDVNPFSESTMKPMLQQIADALDGERLNTDRFRKQLLGLLVAGDQSFLHDRLLKGSEYYKTLVWGNIKKLLAHIESIRDQKRVKAYLTQLVETDQLLSKKLEEIDKAVYLTDAILNGQDKIDLTVANKMRTIERNKLLTEIKKELPSAPISLPKSIKKRTKKGGVKKQNGVSTYDVTVEMLNSGHTAEQIALDRKLTLGTIETHLAKAVAEGRLSIFAFMQEATVMEIVNAYRQLPPEASSKDLFEWLNGKYGYGQLRAAIAHAKMTD